ncbi:PQQ-binding-like beta-propeller repeat protein [Segniliparus rugosus]|uniref:Pyrrolo-quinoline quinone repeat domain-containing protein n=1 Tax=Segniliparus rugosus (strain ATCC BAA-974 / DSM 45345 / CCUG 50838 / CIP 108380 / JCM 13579 / CDC 945) TaxID=679197 RepID=E5XLX8_SEGRC|nr:PQQ-binding-like beta-propeller repeat protein [Segniliparus rugosus]EFV14664.1 hypothetical protein HMPREF9336_00497 [Segniliparus rugosus ATCC BAA-974]
MTTPPGGWGPQQGPYGPSPERRPPSPYAQPPSPYPQPPGPADKSRLRLLLGIGAAALVVVVVAVLAVMFVPGRGHQTQNAQQSAPVEAKDRRRTGGPFLDPIPTLPVSLWTDQAGDIVGDANSSVRFLSANEDTVLLSVLKGGAGGTYLLAELDAATGKKKWQAPAPFGSSMTSCDLAGDSSVLCTTEFAADSSLDTSLSDGLRLAFFGPDGAAGKTFTLDQEGADRRKTTTMYPLKDGFLVRQSAVDGPMQLVTRFSNSGDQRWTVTGPPNQPNVSYSAATGLLLLSGSYAATVYNVDTGQQIADSSAVAGAEDSEAKGIHASLNGSGFTIATSRQVRVFNAQGKQTNLIAGWSSPDSFMRPSSSQCGQIMLGNETGAIAAADAATGQVLWQAQAGGDLSTKSMSCVGGYLLVRPNGSKTVSVFELDTGEKTGTIAVDVASWSVVGTDGSTLLAVSFDGGKKTYFAYDLATGKRSWTSPRSENGQYLVCARAGAADAGDSLVGGGLYYVVPHLGGSITRLGHKG